MLNSFQTSGNSPGAARCRVGIPGFGIVGSVIARRLTGLDSIPSLEVTLICDRRAREERARQPQSVARLVRTDRFDDFLASDVDAVGGVAQAFSSRESLFARATGPETVAVGGFPDHKLAEAV